VWIQSTNEIKPHIVYVVSTFENTICIVLFVGKKKNLCKIYAYQWIIFYYLKSNGNACQDDATNHDWW
jgi:hypothetical protein